MPQRVIKPIWNEVQRPITGKALLLFVAIVFLAYTVISDWQQSRASAERYKAIVQYTEESRAALQGAKQQNDNFEATVKNSAATLIFMQEMSKSMKEVTEILKGQQREHEVIINGRAKTIIPRVKKKNQRRSTLRKCFDFIPRKKRIGQNEVTIYEGIDIPCE